MMDQTITDRFNFIKDVQVAFGTVPATYEALIDLETGFHFNHIEVINTTDQDIILKFANTAATAEWTILAGTTSVKDQFSHNGVIQYHYVGAIAPATGIFKLTSWLGLQ